jgi:hypothetical protein
MLGDAFGNILISEEARVFAHITCGQCDKRHWREKGAQSCPLIQMPKLFDVPYMYG